MDPYEELANAIIVQAVSDYRSARAFLRKHPRTKEMEDAAAERQAERAREREERKQKKLPAIRCKMSREEAMLNSITESEIMLFEVKKFFRSAWFSKLTSLDGGGAPTSAGEGGDRMNVREFLGQALRLDALIQSRLAELEQCRRLSLRLGGGGTDEPVDRSAPREAPFAKWVEESVDRERELNETIDRLVDTKMQISRFIDQVENPQWQCLLRSRYVLCRSWPEVAQEMHCSLSSVKHLHKKILEILKFDTD